MKIVNILCDMQDAGMTPAAVEKTAGRANITLKQYNITSVDENEMLFRELLSDVSDSNIVFIRMHAGTTYFKKFDRLRESLKNNNVPTAIVSEMPQDVDDNADLLKWSDDDIGTLRKYLGFGGSENETEMLVWLSERGHDKKTSKPPHRISAQGIYIPGAGECESADLDKNRPTVAILFDQTRFCSGDTADIDTLYSKIVSKGANCIALFVTSNPNDVTESIGINGSIRRYLTDGKNPIVDVVINNKAFSQVCMSAPGDGTEKNVPNIFEELDVPVIQSPSLFSDKDAWEKSPGLSPYEISMSVFWPEYDGQIISVPLSVRNENGRNVALDDRADALAELAIGWCTLRRTPRSERKIAILLHQNPPRNDMIGGAFGLDAQESTVRLLSRMKDDGYLIDDIPESGQSLTKMLLNGISNDCQWLSASDMLDRAADKVSEKQYHQWISDIDESCKEKMISDWGKPPGEINTVDGITVIPGIRYGNVFIGLQPNRGMTDESADIYHSQDVVAPHNYLAYYRWLTEVFGAQAIIHMGCHGTLEWLPGKGTGLSSRCYPDIILNHVPNIYPYPISNPGEGMHAKRRSNATIVDHMIPSMARSGGYDEITSLESSIQDYMRSEAAGQTEKSLDLLGKIFDKCMQLSILEDVKLTNQSSLKVFAEKIGNVYDYICELKDNLIKDGLHIMGDCPSGEKLDEMIYTLLRMNNGTIRSFRNIVADALGYDLDVLMASPSETTSGVLNGQLIDIIDDECMDILAHIRTNGFDKHLSESSITEALDTEEMSSAIEYICDTLYPNISRITDEMEMTVRALDGRFIPPGPSGAITRGNAHLLPTGKNFYSIDPATIPTRASYDVGKTMAEHMISRHVSEKATYPKQVAIVIWSTDTMKTGGDDIAYVMHLIGIRPIWSVGGKVIGIEPVSLKELGRPRIDVTLRISGLFRDSFPNLVELLDEGIRIVSELDESDEDNYMLAHLRKDMAEDIAKGIDPITSKRKARVRIFGDPPGNYGGGVDSLIANCQWEKREDLGEAFVQWGGYGYGKGISGADMKDCFRKRLSEIDVTVKNHESREQDIFDIDDDYIFLGGLNAAVEAEKGEKPSSFIGDSSDPNNPKLRSLAEESRFVFHSRIMNPKWLNGLKEHGYRGVQEVSNLIEFTFGWDSTSDVMEDWMYQSMAEKFLFDGKTKEWISDNNPDALKQITSRLLEAIERGMWNADEETAERLKSIFMDSENSLEKMNDR